MITVDNCPLLGITLLVSTPFLNVTPLHFGVHPPSEPTYPTYPPFLFSNKHYYTFPQLFALLCPNSAYNNTQHVRPYNVGVGISCMSFCCSHELSTYPKPLLLLLYNNLQKRENLFTGKLTNES